MMSTTLAPQLFGWINYPSESMSTPNCTKISWDPNHRHLIKEPTDDGCASLFNTTLATIDLIHDQAELKQLADRAKLISIVLDPDKKAKPSKSVKVINKESCTCNESQFPHNAKWGYIPGNGGIIKLQVKDKEQ